MRKSAARIKEEIERIREAQSADDFFARIGVGFRFSKRPCRKCKKGRALNEVAAYGSLCEICWCLTFPVSKTGPESVQHRHDQNNVIKRRVKRCRS